ncbi:MAG: V-type ATP synthase subunit I [Oscillospiraceae bacterium]|nr:V-type ATP synthase subunit I [Oscillospiraceae bacterium]
MDKFCLLGLESQREDVMRELQKTETVHFKNLQAPASGETEGLFPVLVGEDLDNARHELSKIDFVLSKIGPYHKKPKGLSALTTPAPNLGFEEFCALAQNYDHDAIYKLVKDSDELQKSLTTEKTRLKTENAALSIWLLLDVSAVELESPKSVLYMLGTLPKQATDHFAEAVLYDFPKAYIEFLNSSKDETGVLILALPEEAEAVLNLAKSHGFSHSNFAPSKVPGEIFRANEAKIREIEAEEARVEEEIKAQAAQYEKLMLSRDYFGMILERHSACENFLKTQNVFAAEGWVASEDSDIFLDAVQKGCGADYFLESLPVEKDCTEVPIKLKNNGLVASFEGVTEMYSMPRYGEIDPTPLLAPFYLLFFAMMFGDAGYGAVLAAATALSLKFFSLKKNTRRFFKFFFYLGIATTAVGILYGSVFGVTVFAPLDGRPILDLTGNIMFMLILSVALGVAQIMAGLIIKGYMLCRDGKILDAIFDSLFWILAVGSLVGLLASAALGLASALGFVCGWVLAGSLFGLALTQGRASKGLGGKIGNGLYSVYNITGYVGDFVSYTRIMAIALAGAYIAYSFNLMASLLVSNLGFLPLAIMQYIFAALVCVFGAALNMGLGALGAYVHTCRLQYVEYFSKFYEGGGVPFRAFGPKNTFVNISNKINIDGRH